MEPPAHNLAPRPGDSTDDHGLLQRLLDTRIGVKFNHRPAAATGYTPDAKKRQGWELITHGSGDPL